MSDLDDSINSGNDRFRQGAVKEVADMVSRIQEAENEIARLKAENERLQESRDICYPTDPPDGDCGRCERCLGLVLEQAEVERREAENDLRACAPIVKGGWEEYRHHNARGDDGPCECDLCMALRALPEDTKARMGL